MKDKTNESKYLNNEIISNYINYYNNPARQFSLSTINFERIYENLEKHGLERKDKSNTIGLDNEKIILDLKYKMRKELYKLMDASDNKSEINNNIKLADNNLLGKKRNFEIPLIDLTHISIKEE